MKQKEVKRKSKQRSKLCDEILFHVAFKLMFSNLAEKSIRRERRDTILLLQ